MSHHRPGNVLVINIRESLNSDVSMMSSASPSARMPLIKKEDDGYSHGGGGGGDCSPSNSTVYSPPSNAHSDLQYCDTSQYMEMRGARSPSSPDRQYCSSTTQPLGDLMMGHIDDETKEDDLPRRLCLVCGDVASGFHYGVASCEACKAFFKRTIQGSIEYSCPSSNDCEVTKRRRKACQACRYRKCLSVGMLKEGVRLDRVRGGRQKYRRSTDSFQTPQYATTFGTTATHPLVFQPATHARLDDNKMLEALAQNEPELLTDAGVGTVTTDMDQSATIVTKLSDLYDRELVGIIGWAKQIPGFTELSLNDQMRLLQSTWAEILILTLAYRSIPKTGKLRFAADFSLDERQARDCGALEVYNQCIHIVDRLEDVRMAKEEYFLLKALVLANSDARLDEVVAPKRFRESILNALTECVAAIRPSSVAQQVCALLLCLPALRQADLTVRRFWAEVRRDGKVTMNKLFVEMLEAYLRL